MRTMQTDIADIRDGQVTGNAGIGATNEAAAASDTATSGLVGLIKRALQRITTLVGLLDGSSLTTATATIANGASLSAAVTLAGKGVIRLNMPATWTAANLTFQVSVDNVTYFDLYDKTGTEYTVTAAVSRSIIMPPADFVGMNYLKIRSGTSGTPVNQGASRDITVITRPF